MSVTAATGVAPIRPGAGRIRVDAPAMAAPPGPGKQVVRAASAAGGTVAGAGLALGLGRLLMGVLGRVNPATLIVTAFAGALLGFAGGAWLGGKLSERGG